MFLGELDLLDNSPTVVFEDNTGATRWTKSEKMSKHVDTRYHFVKDEAENGTVQVEYCRSEKMLADLIKKGLNTDRIEYLRDALKLGRVYPKRSSGGLLIVLTSLLTL